MFSISFLTLPRDDNEVIFPSSILILYDRHRALGRERDSLALVKWPKAKLAPSLTAKAAILVLTYIESISY